ncbi:hypothetical protein [uncultured Ruegeria sp.]|uniref:hypothetical protein n=1 Tax=uncultured Ruegeria sp. TaxID=259304 RepID=UPI0026166223|nr:hypothetical protein [uncultured Ruegeria sp.]
MTELLPKLIKSASGTLTKLTKIRCVESYPLPSSCEPANLFSWPNTRFLDKDGASFLEGRGVCLRDGHIKTFPVPYSLYGEMEKVDDPNVATIKLTRTVLDVFQITAEGKPVTGITAVWDTSEHPNRTVPTSMSDTQGLREFGTHRDSFLLFHREGEKYDIKLRPFAVRSVLREKPELREFAISHRDLRKFVGEKVDSRGRKNRNIVFPAHRDYLRDVVHQTNDAVEKLVGNNNLVSEIKTLYRSK